MELQQLTLTEFCAVTASDAPAPGGGSVSALCGALAASLASMVGKLTVGRKGHETVEETMKEALEELESIRSALLKAIDEDTKSFNAFMIAMKLPKVTEEEKATRHVAMQTALKNAALVPLNVARESVRIFDYARLMLESGNENAFTDAMVCTLAARTATLGALFNVRVNLDAIEDENFLTLTMKEVEILEKLANDSEQTLLKKGALLFHR